MAQLVCKNVSLGYGSRVLVSGLNFELNQGDYLCVVGENGAGKSTLMKTILNLQAPLQGEIFTGDGLKKNEIGYLPQQTAVQKDFPASVWEIVLSGFQAQQGLRPFYTLAQKNRAARTLNRMGILPMAKRSYRELSGGQQQRVLLARALCAAQKILLLDEPVTGLDPLATAEMYQLISELNKIDNVSIIMISHDVHQAVQYASHILHLGQSCFFGTTQEYCNSDIGKIYLKGNSK